MKGRVYVKMRKPLVMLITAVCVLFLIKIFQRFGMIFRKIVEGEGMSEGQNNQSYEKEQ